jgi:tight adherence protein B
MSGALVGVVFGVGSALLVLAVTSPPPVRRNRTAASLAGLLAAAGLPEAAVGRLVLTCAGVGLVTAMLSIVVTRSVVLALIFGVGAAYAPIGLLRRRVDQRRDELRDVWPDVVDDLVSGVRAGLALPEAIAQVARRSPPSIAPAFERFAADYRTSGSFGRCLDELKVRLADPVGDRICESLRLARDVGGSDLGRLLRSLSAFLREDARVRGELETRQGWTVNAAKLAAAAPWVTVALLGIRPDAVEAYDSPTGVVVLLVGAVVTVVAYRVMLRVGRLPTDVRVMR